MYVCEKFIVLELTAAFNIDFIVVSKEAYSRS